MYPTSQRLHFKSDDAYNGFAEVEGIMRLEKNHLVLEFQTKDSIVGMLKSKPKELRIPFSELAEIQYKLNWFMSRFKLQVTSMHILSEFPGGKDGIISVKIKRKQKEAAKEMESQINLRLSEYRLKMMEEEEGLL